MRNKVTTIIFIILIVLLIVAMGWGIKIGSFQVLSISQLKEKNQKLNEKITQASNLTSTEYPKNVDTLEETYETYKIQKQKYEEISDFEEDDTEKVYETKQYDIGYLWKTIGKYATSYNLQIEMNLQKTTGEDLYDLKFNVSGEYVNISQFIKKIENNSDLYFRIYNFKMTGSNTVTSSFVVKDVRIDPSTITGTAVSSDLDIENSDNNK